jgi:Ran GTPase-activating protein (RanGAP) involved in mRNA processing and transport
MKRTYSLFQDYTASVLLISFLLQSCGGGFDNSPLIPTQKEKITLLQTQEALALPEGRPVAGQTLIAQGGHAVTFREKTGALIADVSVNTPQGFSKTYEGLDVCIEQGADLPKLHLLDKKSQERRIHLQPAHAGKPAKVIIYKGAGLMAGMLQGEEEAEDEQEEESMPNEYFCPITQEIMEDPVMARDGHTYERASIQRWFSMGNQTSPKTGARLPSTDLIPNYSMRSLIQDLKGAKKQRKKQQEEKSGDEIKKNEEDMIKLLPDGEYILKWLHQNSMAYLALEKFNDTHIKILTESSVFKSASRIREINVAGRIKCKITYQGAVTLARNLQGTSVQKVDLGYHKIGPQGVVEFAKALQGTSVQEVELWDNQIGDQGVREFAKALQGTNVQVVYLGDNQIGDQGAREFAKALQGTNVREVKLSCNQIGDQGATEFAKNLQGTQVKCVDLRNNQIAARTQVFLKDKYPHIEWILV